MHSKRKKHSPCTKTQRMKILFFRGTDEPSSQSQLCFIRGKVLFIDTNGQRNEKPFTLSKRIHKRLTNSITMIFSNLNFLFLFFLIFHLTPTFQCSNAMFFGKATVQNWCGDMYLCTDTISCSRF